VSPCDILTVTSLAAALACLLQRWAPRWAHSSESLWWLVQSNALRLVVVWPIVSLWTWPCLTSALELVDLPLYLQVGLFLVLRDFCAYWLHRAQHTFPRLWRYHSTHHEATSMHPLVAERVHPAECVWEGVLLGVLFGSGVSVLALLLSGTIMLACNLYRHADVPGPGPLWRVLLTNPHFHGWHHERSFEAVDRNFAFLLPMWDRFFGTSYEPDEEPREFGLAA
jgi:sterol desaturase/sphingolipid hydroxylase (fatty acid hydroxylase superfamily)